MKKQSKATPKKSKIAGKKKATITLPIEEHHAYATPKPVERALATRGGARINAGRPARVFEIDTFNLRMPQILSEGIQKAGIDNKTAYINYLVAQDLAKRLGAKNGNQYAKFARAYKQYAINNPD